MLETLRGVPGGATSRQIQDAVVDGMGLDREAVRSLVQMLLSLYTVRNETSVDPRQLAVELLEAAKEFVDPATVEPLRAQLVAFVSEVMSLDGSLGLTARALEVMHEHPQTYCNARLFTDLRPVFDSQDPTKIHATVVVHSLRLTYHEGLDTKDFFLAMSRAELEELRDVLQRALAKDEAARCITGLPVLDSESHRS